jgi:hypothetical protein
MTINDREIKTVTYSTKENWIKNIPTSNWLCILIANNRQKEYLNEVISKIIDNDVCGLFLILGFKKRISCSFLIIDMFVATFIFHKGLLLQNGMTTFLLLICCLTIFLSATDKLSIDWLIIKCKMK